MKKERKWKKEVETGVKREGKTLSHSASFLRKGNGWRHLVLCHSQTVETSAIFYKKCTGRSPVPLAESTPVLQGSHHIVFTIVCGWGRKKKGGGSRGGKKNLSLCVGRSQQESDFVIIWVCQQSEALPPELQQRLQHPAAFRRSHIRACFSGPANSDTRASPDDESWRQTGFHEYWCGG